MSFKVHSKMFKRAYGHNLDRDKNWYAYNKSLLSYQENRNPEASKTFKCFPTEVKRVKLEELQDDEGRQVSWWHFYAGRKMNIQDVFVISTLGIVVLFLRHHIDGWLNTEIHG